MSTSSCTVAALLLTALVGCERNAKPPSARGGGTSKSELVARLLDDDGRPIASVGLAARLKWNDESRSGSTVNEVTSGPDGAIRFTVADGVPADANASLVIAEPEGMRVTKIGWAAAHVDITQRFGSSVNDLGYVVLHVPGSRKFLQARTDDELERIYRAARSGDGFARDATQDGDTCLTEMIARGGERWRKFLAREVDASRSEGLEHAITDVALLTALRRIEHRGDPVELVVHGAPVIDVEFPNNAVIEYDITNVDAGHETIAIIDGYLDWRTDGFSRIELRASDGTSVERAQPTFWPNGSFCISSDPIAPGESRLARVNLTYRSQLSIVGRYTARLLERHGEERFGDAVGGPDGWICSRSDEFTVLVLPRSIAIPKIERQRLRARFDAIDFTGPPIVVDQPRRPDDEFVGPVASPEDELFRAGWTAVPVLLDVLDDATASVDAQSWAIALLWDVTGLNSPDDMNPKHGEPWSSSKLRDRWPTVRPRMGDVDHGIDESFEDARVDPSVVAELRRRWTETRKSLAIHE